METVTPFSFMPIKAINLEKTPRLKTGIESFDTLAKGGLPVQGIIEMYGASGIGKTQLCLQLALTAQLPKESNGLEGGVAYICTEGTFPSNRLQEMVSTIPRKYKYSYLNFMDNIFVKSILEISELMDCLQNVIPNLIEQRNVKLIIIDSLAALFRGTDDFDAATRAQELRVLGGILLKLSSQGIGVICVNQVTTNISTSQLIPVLGLAWANMVTTRIELDDHQNLNVVFSPCLPKISAPFKILKRGVRDVTANE